MPDFITNITAKDNASSTINKVKDGFKSIGDSTKDLERIKTTFDKITTSTKPVKKQLQELQALMVNTNVKGLTNTDVFTEVAQKAGELKDAMADARQAVNAYADDTFKIQATADAFSGVASVISLSTSAMALFGKENKDVERTLLKVQAAMGVMNSVQQIANLLNKDSAVMLRLKQIRMEVATATQAKLTTATVAGTAAEVASNTVTKTGTVVQTAWNAAKAIAKALMGDFTGLLLVGAGVMATYAVATADSRDNLEDMGKETEDVSKATKNFRDVSADTYARLMTSYTQLKNEWKQLSSEHQKNQWIKDNASKLDELQLSITDVNSAEQVFNGNTDSVVQAFVERAKAAARLAELTEEYRKQMKLIDEMADIEVEIKTDAEKFGRKAKAGDEIKDQTYRNSRYGNVNRQGQWVFHEQGAKLYSGTDASTNPQLLKKQEEFKKSQDKTNNIIADIGKDAKSIKTINSKTTHSSKTPPKKDKKDEDDKKVTYKEGSINAMREEVSKLEKDLRDGVISEKDIENTVSRINELKDKIEKEEIRIGLKIDPDEIKLQEEKKKVEDKLKSLKEQEVEIEFTPKVSSFEKAIGKQDEPKTEENKLDDIQNQMDFNDRLIETLKKLQAAYAALGDAGVEGYTRIQGAIDEVTKSQEKLGEQGAVTNKKIKKQEKLEKTLNGIGDAAQQTGSLLGQMAEATDSKELKGAALVAEAVANIMLGFAQASAQSASLGPAWPFWLAASLAAVGTVIATIHSISGFANGGIIGGKTTIGDYNLARVNKGEMILNTRQQENLFKMIDSGRMNNGANAGGKVVFELKGKKLQGVLNNYGDTMKKLR